VWARDQHGNTANCAVGITLADSAFICTELPIVCAHTYWDTTLIIENVETKMVWQDTTQAIWNYVLPPFQGGCNILDTFPQFTFTISERSLSDPLNGVTTFDLLLISRHILAIEALDQPWKVIAADANFSGSVTTNDVVQLRRLILGITQNLPEDKSWRFFTDNCQFPANPFEVTNCATGYEFEPMPFWAFPREIRFYGLKTGDVNNSAIANTTQSAAAYRSGIDVEIPDVHLNQGDIADIPLRLEQSGNWAGFQCSLPFDANQIEILDVSAGETLNPQEFAFALPEPGMLRVSWFDVRPEVLLPGESLFHLRVKALKPVQLRETLALPVAHAGSLASEIYSSDHEISRLQFVFREAKNKRPEVQVFDPQPNPTSAGARIPIRLNAPEHVLLEIGNLEGKSLYFNDLSLLEGAHLLDIPASVFPKSGVYTWQVRIGGQVHRGKLVRL
jgi:hypothetical protein